MADYTKTTNFASKDSLPSGDSGKIIKGTEFNVEFDAIATAIATKANLIGPTTFTGTTTLATVDINGGAIDGTTIGASSAAAGTFTNLTASGTVNFNGATVSNLGTITTANLDGGSIDGAVIGANTAAAGTFTALAASSATVGGAAVLTSVSFSNLDAGAVTTSGETFTDSDTQIPTNAAVKDHVEAVIPTLSVTEASVTAHQAALAITASQLSDVTSTATELNILDGVTSTTAELNILDGVTATTTELNLLDGVTATTAELNYTDGVTSNIQTQLDSKVGANYTGDVNITGELLVDSYNETFKKVSSVSATTGYLLSSASYASKSFDFTTQTADPQAVHFNNNGTKMYTIDQNAVTIYQYSLSTAYDVSTASYDSVSFSGYSQADVSYGFNFNNDGTKFYILSVTNNSVYQYSCSTAYDMSTASYDSKSFSHASQETSSTGIVFNANGTKMYIVGSSSDAIYQYTLSTAFDVSTASYDSVSLSVSSQTSQPTDLAINSDGTKMFICDNTNDSVFQYNLTTAYDLSTASYSSTSFSVTSQDTIPNGLSFSADGTKMYMVGTNTDTVYQYSVSATTYTTTFDCENANVFETVLDANTTVVFSNPPAAGTATDSTAYAMSLKVVQDSSASGYTVTWPTSVDWPSATAPTLTATASAVDQFVFYTYDGGTNWYGFTAGQALG